MSGAELVRGPVWSGLEPGLPAWDPADGDEARRLQADAGIAGAVHCMRTDGEHAGFYRLAAKDGRQLFLKRVGPERARAVRQAEAIAAWLAARGVPTPAPPAGFPRDLPDGFLLCAAPFLDGRRLRAEPEAMDGFGAALARLHAALAAHPDRAAWVEATGRRLEELARVRGDLAGGRRRAGPAPAALAALAADPALDFLRRGAARHPLHGDLNPGNVLVDETGPVFLDFEDVPHSVLPPVFELVLVLERFVLLPLADNRKAVAVGRRFLAAYARAGAGCDLSDPVGALRSLALRSLCVLAAGAERGLTVPDAEWYKFLDLAARATARTAELTAIAEAARS